MAQDQTQGGGSAQDALRIIRFWQTIEALLPAAPPKVSPDNKVRDVSCDNHLPWGAELREYYPHRADRRWVFLVHIGIFGVEPIVEEICKLMGVDDDPERVRAGEASLACIVVDGAGRVISKPSISALPWGMRQLIRMRNSGNFEAKDFSEIETELIESIEVYLQQERIISSGDVSKPDDNRPLRVRDFSQIIDIVNGKAGWSPGECIAARYKGIFQKRKKNDEFPEVEPDIINSFFIKDLGRVSDSIASDRAGEATTKFLFGIGERDRKDLRDTQLQRRCLHPRLLPDGQWPSKPDEALVLAQQIAVNLAAEMGDRSDLMGVNGPPGTGKTTLLRDLIAANIVKRAERLCTLTAPNDAFSRRLEIKGSDFPAWQILDTLRGFEMVVASSNNGAVENVTEELPMMKAIADCWREQALHFREVADAILAPQDQPDVAGICWGLIAAALGKKENRSNFADRFWFCEPKNKQAERPVSMRRALNTADSKQERWENAQHNFRRALEDFAEYRKRLVQVADAQEQETEFGSQLPSEKDLQDAKAASAEADERWQRAVSRAEQLAFSLKTVSEALGRSRDLRTASHEARRRKAEADACETHCVSMGDEQIEQRYQSLREQSLEARENLQWYNQTRPNWWKAIFDRGEVKAWNEGRSRIAESLRSICEELDEVSRRFRLTCETKTEVSRLKQAADSARREEEAARISLSKSLDQFDPASEVCSLLRQVLGDKFDSISALQSKFDALLTNKDLADRSAAKTSLEAKKLKDRCLQLDRRNKHLSSKLKELHDLIQRCKAGIDPETLLPDTAFIALPEKERQTAAPWQSPTLNRLRVSCFLRALELHAAFLACSTRAKQNLSIAVDLLKGKTGADAIEGGPASVWATLSMAVPVVSTTFASFDRMFGGMGAESIGWLLVDEAGQATPQAALGGIWRAKRAVIIGDPLQLEPIITLPDKAVEAIRKVFGVPTGYHPVSSSTQRLADNATRYGTELLQSNGNSLWVGCPLRVHRRCYWPMFEVANTIAYNDEMVWKTKVDEDWTTQLGDSRWIDCRAARAQEHYFEGEGRIALYLLLRCRQEAAVQDKEANIFVITPFRSVLERFRDLASSIGKVEEEWLQNFTGTIHTFQGKEAEFVVILLGGNPSRKGAFDWASESPNLLNVALTRAKKRAYIVGNRQRWQNYSFFSTLAKRFEYEMGHPEKFPLP